MGSPQLSIILLDPKHQQPQSPDLPPMDEHLEQPERADPAIKTFEQRVDIRKDHANCCWFIIVIHEKIPNPGLQRVSHFF